MSLYEAQLAKIKRTKEHQERERTMTQRQVVESLVKAQPELNRQPSGSVNIREFLQNKPQSSDPNVAPVRFGAQSLSDVLISKPIDVSQIKDTSWMRGETYKQHEARKTLADYETIPTNIPRGTPKTEEPAARRMGFGQGGGAANLGLTGYQTITEPAPTNFTEWITGRINTPLQEPKTITKEPEIIEVTPEPIIEHSVKQQKEPINKSLIVIGAVIGLAALFLIWRMKK
jgi:hypothetical protein|tara:strand:+ start:5689 stop:6378 length:690 start_codon:yes stop_codon:yes gene_type:complete